MKRPSYLSKYLFDWETLDVVVSGRSALDSKFFISPTGDQERVNHFLKSYGLDPGDPVSRAELFGNFQEALQFIKRYFLIEGSKDGLDFKIPNSVYMITDISDLLNMATLKDSTYSKEERLWAEIILKVMHTILHADKDLRSNYFNVIQTQIFDRFYKYVYRNDDKELFLGLNTGEDEIRLIDFETKSKKTRDSVIIKLLHKAENVAEELFDRVGVRFITETRFDTLRVIKFLIENNVIIPHNVKPSRSMNTMVDLGQFKYGYQRMIKQAMKNNLDEQAFINSINQEMVNAPVDGGASKRNSHSLDQFRSIQFTCRQLVKYKNPFLKEFKELRKMAKAEEGDNQLAKKILGMDLALISRDTRFFYPYEVQVVDVESHRNNSEGEASHQEYKRNQTISAMKRVFRNLLEYKNISLD
jgi:uncharacterized protein (TIGR04562 family)